MLQHGRDKSKWRNIFNKYRDADKQVNYINLQKALSESLKDHPFSSDMCKEFVALHDSDHTGSLNRLQFTKMMREVACLTVSTY